MRTLFRRSFLWLIPASLKSRISRKEGSMNLGSRPVRALLATPILLLLVCATASADNVNIFLAPNQGAGGNFAFSSSGPPGFAALIVGGTATFSWDNDTEFSPGTSFAGYTMRVYPDGGILLVNGVTFDFDNFSLLGPASLQILNSFTLPSNGKNFTTPVEMEFEATVLLSNGTVYGIGGIASGTLTFAYDAPLGVYFVQTTQLTSTPEPGAFFLTATGITGLAGLWMKRRSHA